MNKRLLFSAVLLCLLVCILCACKAEKPDNTFTVDYVATASGTKPVILIVGQCQGRTVKMDAGSFKDCTLLEAKSLSDSPTLSGTEEGYLKINEGILIRVKDAKGAEHKIEVKEGSVFTLDTSVDGAWRILLPDSEK